LHCVSLEPSNESSQDYSLTVVTKLLGKYQVVSGIVAGISRSWPLVQQVCSDPVCLFALPDSVKIDFYVWELYIKLVGLKCMPV
jgi:hypothetical protein